MNATNSERVRAKAEGQGAVFGARKFILNKAPCCSNPIYRSALLPALPEIAGIV
jgi:hypothetical protein